MDAFQLVAVVQTLLVFLMADSYLSYPLDTDNQNVELFQQRQKLVNQPQKYCGRKVRETLSMICASYPSLSASTYRPKASDHSRITIECCYNACSLEHLAKYCATTSKPLWSLAESTTLRNQENRQHLFRASSINNAILKDRSASYSSSSQDDTNSKTSYGSSSSIGDDGNSNYREKSPTTTTTRIPPRFGTVPEEEQENRPFRPSHFI